MQVMEDVHEGCDTQPSLPGHADQRSEVSDSINNLPLENPVLANDDPEIAPENQCAGKSDVKLEIQDEEEIQSQEIKLESAIPCNSEENDLDTNPAVEDDSVDDSPVLKRKLVSPEASSPSKKFQTEAQKHFMIRDAFLNKYMESLGCNSLEQIQTATEQILVDVKSLNELARQKEKEWNNVIHLKKLKEELLLRLQRQRHLLLINNDDFELYADGGSEPEDKCQNWNGDLVFKQQKSVLSGKKLEVTKPTNLIHQDKSVYGRQKNYNGKSLLYASYEMNGQGDYKQQQQVNKQRSLIDVKSIIADYRQKHPETVPRRGRRIRTVMPHIDSNGPLGKMEAGGNVLNLSNVALGSGAQVRQNTSEIDRELGQFLNAIGESRKDGLQPLITDFLPAHVVTSEILAQFAKLSQSERHELLHNAMKPPPPYPEVTVHPVPTITTSASSSLLHGILTKTQSKMENKSTFSPTLARLLTAPEKNTENHQTQSNNIPLGGVASISDILCGTKTRNEITITPVGGQFETQAKIKSNQVDEDEAEDSVDRLVIDEGGEMADTRTKMETNSEAGDEVPQCQGCNQKAAQFVCAGCGNQWYCSRDCQVSAWDEHSEVCSG